MPHEIALPGLLPAWSVAALIVLTVTAAVVDLRCGKIPNWLTYPAILIGLCGHAAAGYAAGGGIAGAGREMGLTGALLGLAVGCFPLLLCYLAGGIGGGDVKLMGAVGAIGGWEVALGAMLYGFILAGLMAVVVMIRRRIVRRTLRRVWHTILLILLPVGRPADPTGPDSPTIPVAVALCGGTLAVLLVPLIVPWAKSLLGL